MASPQPTNARHIQIADVDVGECIGNGALGEVRVGKYDGNDVALKSLHMLRTDESAHAEWGRALSPIERRQQLALLHAECETLRKLHHPNVLPFIGVVVDTDSEPLYLATQFIEGGTLHDLIYNARYAQIRDEAGQLPLLIQLRIAHDIFSGLAYLAGEQLIHRDIKPANILAVVQGGRLGKVLLADFGESKQLTRSVTRVAGTVAGTPLYMAPEMYEEEEATGPKADVFSAGVVLVEMSSGRQPTPGPQMRRRVHVLEEERRAEDLARVRHPQILALAQRCIVDNEIARASATDIRDSCAQMLIQRQHTRESTLQVKLLDGSRFTVSTTATTTIAEVIGRVCAELGQQRLVFAGKQLDPSQTVDDYNLLDGTQVHMLSSAGEEVSAERQRREVVEGLNVRLHADISRLESEVERLRIEKAQIHAQAQATIASLHQELRQEKQMRRDADESVRQIQIQLQSTRLRREPVVFPKMTDDVDCSQRIIDNRSGNLSQFGKLQEQSIGQLPGERFVAMRCWHFISPMDSARETKWHFLTNYGRISNVCIHCRVPGDQRTCRMNDLQGDLLPLSAEYLELASLLNYPCIETMNQNGSIQGDVVHRPVEVAGAAADNGGGMPSGDEKTRKQKKKEEKSIRRQRKYAAQESIVEGLIRVYKKYHPQAAAQFEEQGNGY